MILSSLSNSRTAVKPLCIFNPSEQEGENGEGIYIGKTQLYRIPFFLDTDRLLNPHIVTLGMTGSGKTYFMKSYLIKFMLGGKGSILILDWNGEYDELVSFLDGKTIELKDRDIPDFDVATDGLLSINLSKAKDDAVRRDIARQVVDFMIESMHSMPISGKKKRIFLVDEAWRALGDNNRLGQLFREGRKYGFSIMVSTQLAKDVNNEVLANAGAILVFRLQNADDYSTLIGSGIITNELQERLSDLGIGSCAVRLAYKDDTARRAEVFIRRIDGVSTSVYTIKGDKMQIKVSSKRFSEVTGSLIGDSGVRAKLANFVEANDRNLDLGGLVKFLGKNGLKRADIITYLRLLGLDDLTIINAYESTKGIVLTV